MMTHQKFKVDGHEIAIPTFWMRTALILAGVVVSGAGFFFWMLYGSVQGLTLEFRITRETVIEIQSEIRSLRRHMERRDERIDDNERRIRDLERQPPR